MATTRETWKQIDAEYYAQQKQPVVPVREKLTKCNRPCNRCKTERA